MMDFGFSVIPSLLLRAQQRLGLSTRQIQRYIAELEAAGLVQRIERRPAQKGKQSNYFDLSGLVERLNVLEPEFRQVSAETTGPSGTPSGVKAWLLCIIRPIGPPLAKKR